MSADPDIELFTRWCDGDQVAGNELFRRHFASILRFFQHKVRQPGDVEELVQNTFLACVGSRERFRREGSVRAFLFSIARHTLYGYWRECKRVGAHQVDVGSTSLVELMTTPATRIARGQDRMRLLAAMRTLPLDQQLLLELHYWEELDSPALAEVFDIAPPTARSRLHRARAALRERLDRAPDLPDLSESSVADFDQWARLLRDRAEIESC